MNENTSEIKKSVNKRSLTVQEQKSIDRVKQRDSIKSQPLFRACETEGKESFELALDESLENREAIDLLNSCIMSATGSSRPVGLRLLSNLAKAILPSKISNKETAEQLDVLAQSMQALAPLDEFEGQLVSQLIILHEHALDWIGLDWLGRAVRTERVDFSNVYLNGASKLLTRHHETLEALLKYRRKGEQRVHVEHVHVHGGGQAIVGNVTSGGGMKPLIEEGPYNYIICRTEALSSPYH